MEPVVLRPRFGRPRLAAPRSEAELLAGVRRGDDAAFEALYDAYHRRLLAFCQHMLGSREEAEDVLQHTFLAAYRSLRAGYEVVDLKPWLYTIARNRCLSVVRARRDEVELDDDAPATEGLAAEVDRRTELRTLVGDVQRLPPDQRAALILFEVGDHSHKEIAAVLGVRREKVKALVFQAREALMGWRTARETPCAHVREQLATLRGRALGRATIRRHVELCSGCADYEAAVRCQRAALAIALPVVPAAGLRAAVLGSMAGGSGLGGAVGAGGATSAAGGLAGLGVNGVAAKVLLVTALVGGAGVARHATVDQAHQRPGVAAAAPGPRLTPPVATARLTTVARDTATSAAPVHRADATAPAEHAAMKVEAKARPDHVRAARGDSAVAATSGHAAAPGQLKAPGTPAQGKALGAAQTKDRGPKSARVKVKPGQGSAAPKPPKPQAVSRQPSKPPKAPKAPKAPEAAVTAPPAAPEQSAALPPGQAKKQDDPPKKP
ncbi:MAG: sigma-70 family RNA polymerase sigma factor [Solirubrobacteraceae bacterium]